MVALYYSKIKYSITENGKRVPTARYDFMAKLIDRLGRDRVIYVTPDCYDPASDVFTAGYKLGDDKKLQRVETRFKPRILVDRGFFGPRNPESSIPTISNRNLRAVSLDKFTMYDSLVDFMPKSFQFTEGKSIDDLPQYIGEEFIVKYRRGSGGNSIWVMNKAELTDSISSGKLVGDLLIQQLVESDGIKAGLGFAGRHDVRLFVAGDRVVGCYIRRPAKNKYISNVNKGGTLDVVSPSTLPGKLIEFAGQVLRTLPGGLRVFSVDCFYDAVSGQWRVIEINANAGLPSKTYGPAAVECLDGIADYIASTYNEMGGL